MKLENTLVVVEKSGRTMLRRVCDAAYVGAVVASTGLVAANANAASSLDFSGATGEIDGVKTAIVTLIGGLVVIIGIVIAWTYFKRSAK